jgi:hypothetical protein
MKFAPYLLPYIFQVPPRKSKRPSNDEAAFHFIQVYAVSLVYLYKHVSMAVVVMNTGGFICNSLIGFNKQKNTYPI